MLDKTSIYRKTTADYLRQIQGLDLPEVSETKGARVEEAGLSVPLFGRQYTVGLRGITDSRGKEPDHAVQVVLCRYLLHEAAHIESDEWVSFKDFPDAAPLVDAFRNNAEKAVADDFSGRMDELLQVAEQLGGCKASMGWSYDLVMRFEALPRVPILLLYNDADEEFSSQCLQLFERRAANHLDMESLAILGWILADCLRGLRPIGDEV